MFKIDFFFKHVGDKCKFLHDDITSFTKCDKPYSLYSTSQKKRRIGGEKQGREEEGGGSVEVKGTGAGEGLAVK